MLPREEDDDDEAERTTTRDETFTPKFTLLRPRQTGNERTPMPTTHGELDEEAVPTAAICLLGAAIVPATPASTTIAIATPKPSIPASVSRSPSYPLLELEKKTTTQIGIPVSPTISASTWTEIGDRGIAGRSNGIQASPRPLGYGAPSVARASIPQRDPWRSISSIGRWTGPRCNEGENVDSVVGDSVMGWDGMAWHGQVTSRGVPTWHGVSPFPWLLSCHVGIRLPGHFLNLVVLALWDFSFTTWRRLIGGEAGWLASCGTNNSAS